MVCCLCCFVFVCFFRLLSLSVCSVCGKLCAVVLFVFVVWCLIACHLGKCLCDLCLIYCVLLYGLFRCVVVVVWTGGFNNLLFCVTACLK